MERPNKLSPLRLHHYPNQDLQIWYLSKPLRYTLDQGDLGEREYEVVAEVGRGGFCQLLDVR